VKNRIINAIAATIAIVLVGAVAYSQLAARDVTANTGDSSYTKVYASSNIGTAGGVYAWDGVAASGKGIVLRTFSVTLSSGNGSKNFGAGKTPVSCSPNYAQSTIRSFSINTGLTGTTTATFKLGGGGATSDAIAGTCQVIEARP
jgi:hypothetical protein